MALQGGRFRLSKEAVSGSPRRLFPALHGGLFFYGQIYHFYGI
ncbi:hypothetical protein [Fictibacillus sp. S7]|nr:hypothetical protein [Fictibacillus sp. S7]